MVLMHFNNHKKKQKEQNHKKKGGSVVSAECADMHITAATEATTNGDGSTAFVGAIFPPKRAWGLRCVQGLSCRRQERTPFWVAYTASTHQACAQSMAAKPVFKAMLMASDAECVVSHVVCATPLLHLNNSSAKRD